MRLFSWHLSGGLSQYPRALTGLTQVMYVVVDESREGRYYD